MVSLVEEMSLMGTLKGAERQRDNMKERLRKTGLKSLRGRFEMEILSRRSVLIWAAS